MYGSAALVRRKDRTGQKSSSRVQGTAHFLWGLPVGRDGGFGLTLGLPSFDHELPLTVNSKLSLEVSGMAGFATSELSTVLLYQAM